MSFAICGDLGFAPRQVPLTFHGRLCRTHSRRGIIGPKVFLNREQHQATNCFQPVFLCVWLFLFENSDDVPGLNCRYEFGTVVIAETIEDIPAHSLCFGGQCFCERVALKIRSNQLIN